MTGFSEKQMEIFKFMYEPQYKALVCDGAVRSGKTMCMSFAFITWAFQNFNGMNFAICGKTVRSAERNVLRPITGLTYLKEHYKMKYNSTAHCLEVSRGNKSNYFWIFGGKDESSYALIQGITLAGVLLDEVALMPQSFVNQALARCSVERSKTWFNCNPENPAHWFYNDWILGAEGKKAKHIHFLMSDNPSLSEEKLAEYETYYKGAFYRRYVLGEWVKAEGLVYPMFDKSKHIISKYDKRGRYYISVDYGTINPTVFQLWRVNYNLPNPIVLCKEYYYNSRAEDNQHIQKTDTQYYDDLRNFANGYTIERIIIDPSAASFKTLIKQRGQFIVSDADNSVLDGIRFTGDMIASGKVKFCESCINTFAEFGAYVWDEEKTVDTVIKENDHAMDAMRYFMYTIVKKDKKAGVFDDYKFRYNPYN